MSKVKNLLRSERARGSLFLTILWLGATVFLWVIPIPHHKGGELKFTGRGIFSWQEITPSGQVVSTNEFNFAITLIVFTAITALLVFAWFRLGRPTYPHGGRCNHCGYDVSHTKSTNCPECGKVHYHSKEPWKLKFWR